MVSLRVFAQWAITMAARRVFLRFVHNLSHSNGALVLAGHLLAFWAVWIVAV